MKIYLFYLILIILPSCLRMLSPVSVASAMIAPLQNKRIKNKTNKSSNNEKWEVLFIIVMHTTR